MEGRPSFLKKRSKKRLPGASHKAEAAREIFSVRATNRNGQKFFGAFFQKRTAFSISWFCAQNQPPAYEDHRR
jgi:hypothetical protein